ncbi:tetratricopeptide repeat protein [Aridibaculum aurantiacum]|uniref:tetratricopeptide repeat protein n=1 Tax=Aridibaculum aurantiacum TaxID=2810307 RepID=UPI001A97A6EE|nr:tetratricopeptide repeat protein [Aridibaculum aurantiacum]
MADNKVQEVEPNESLTSVQGFWEKNKKAIIGVSAAIIVLAAGWLAYKHLVKEPNNARAAEAMFKAEEFFRNDSLDLALNGNGQYKGFLHIINNFGGTPSANLAHYYAGVIYLKKQDFNNAVKHLKNFTTDADQVQMIAYGKLGDAYSEQGKKEEAVEQYKKAGKHFPEDEVNSSEFLFRAGYLLESMGKNQEAVDVYKQIKQKYPRTEKGFSIDKYIYRLSIEKNDFSVK